MVEAGDREILCDFYLSFMQEIVVKHEETR
jgi:hypothetical protein